MISARRQQVVEESILPHALEMCSHLLDYILEINRSEIHFIAELAEGLIEKGSKILSGLYTSNGTSIKTFPCFEECGKSLAYPGGDSPPLLGMFLVGERY